MWVKLHCISFGYAPRLVICPCLPMSISSGTCAVWVAACRCRVVVNPMKIGGWGCSTGKSLRFVRACVRAVWLPGCSFSFLVRGIILFGLLVLLGSLSTSLLGSGPFNCPYATPKPSIQL